jgi:hypothetical protein
VKEMTKAHIILIAVGMVVLFPYNVRSVSGKGLKEDRKLATMSPTASSLSGLASGNTNGVSSNTESSNTDMYGGTGAAYTPTTATTTDSHHVVSTDQYWRIIHNNQIKP